MTDCRRYASIAALMIAVLALPARAADNSDGSAVILDTDRSLVLMGGNVNPAKPVEENFIAAGGRIIVEHPVGRSVTVAGGSVDVRAPIGHSVRAAGGSVDIENTVGANVSIAAGEARLGRAAVVGGNAKIFAGTITIDGRIDGSLQASADRIIINGEVRGDVKAAADEIVLGPGAKVLGSMRYVSAHDLTKDDSATIAGAVTRKLPGAEGSGEEEVPRVKRGTGATIFGIAVSFLALLGCGALFLSVAPIFSVESPDRIKASPWQALGVGLLTLIGVPVVAAMFILTIVGIPVGLMLLMLYVIALLLGFIVGTLFIGNAGAGLLKRPPPPTVTAAIGYFAIALVVVMAVGKLPGIGGLLLCVLILLGVGAFAVELYRRMKGGSRTRRVSSAAA